MMVLVYVSMVSRKNKLLFIGDPTKCVILGSHVQMIESPLYFLEVDRATFLFAPTIEVSFVVVEPEFGFEVSCVVDVIPPIGVVEVVEVVPRANDAIALLHVAPSKKPSHDESKVNESGNALMVVGPFLPMANVPSDVASLLVVDPQAPQIWRFTGVTGRQCGCCDIVIHEPHAIVASLFVFSDFEHKEFQCFLKEDDNPNKKNGNSAINCFDAWQRHVGIDCSVGLADLPLQELGQYLGCLFFQLAKPKTNALYWIDSTMGFLNFLIVFSIVHKQYKLA